MVTTGERLLAHAEHLLDLLAERGLAVRDRVRWSQVLSPADLEQLFLVGGSSHPGGGLPLVALSAQIVAGLVGPA